MRVYMSGHERIKSSRSQAPQDKSCTRTRVDVTPRRLRRRDKKGTFTVKSRRVDRASSRCDQCSDISGEPAMRSLPGINEAIISCHRELVAPSRSIAPRPRLRNDLFSAAICNVARRAVVQPALDETGIARWHNVRRTAVQFAQGSCIIIVVVVIQLVRLIVRFISDATVTRPVLKRPGSRSRDLLRARSILISDTISGLIRGGDAERKSRTPRRGEPAASERWDVVARYLLCSDKRVSLAAGLVIKTITNSTLLRGSRMQIDAAA